MQSSWDYVTRLGDLEPPLQVASVGLDPETNVGGATGLLFLKPKSGGAAKTVSVDLAMSGGEVVATRNWQTGDLDVAGYWYAYVEVTLATGRKFTFPKPEKLRILVEPGIVITDEEESP